MIVGTAGHIDHGKTTLVKALTGVDTDRLPEEKKRGISIELGYAFLGVPGRDERIGFIDVPGHERLVHTMLAGATGIDLGLLLVAADDGPMPQTREHLAVLSLLGLPRGAMVITKTDRADAARRDLVRIELGALVQGSVMQSAPVFEISALTGQGVSELREWLWEQAGRCGQRAAADHAFRLAVDRSFTLDGVGTVATGTVHAGQLRAGAELALTPGLLRARVRSLHAQNLPVEQAGSGQRCAVALVGLNKTEVERGHWLVEPAVALQTDRIDASMTLWHGETKPLRSGTAVHVHLGSVSMPGTLAVLAPESWQPGATALVQLVLRQPVGAWHGDRVVLRDASASRTLAGGMVLDPLAPVRYRRTAARLAELAAWTRPSAEQRLLGLLDAAAHGVDLRRWQRSEGLRVESVPALAAGALRVQGSDHDMALAPAQVKSLTAHMLQVLRTFHVRSPEELGPDSARLRRLVAPRLPDPLWRGLLAAALQTGALAQRGTFVHLPEHGLRLSVADERLAQKAAAGLAAAGFEGAWVRDLARDTQENEALMRTTLARLAQRGEMHQVVKDLYYPLPAMVALAAIARRVAQDDGEVKAAAFRDATGLGRKRAIQVLEYFDRIGLLRRVDDVHRLRPDSMLFREDH